MIDLIMTIRTVLFLFAVSLFIYMIAAGPSSKYERTGGHVPPDPTPDRCHLTERIHAAARDAGLCVDCGETREKCGGFMPEVSVGSPRAPRWVCGVNSEFKRLNRAGLKASELAKFMGVSVMLARQAQMKEESAGRDVW